MGIKTEPKVLFGPGKFRAEGGEWVEKSEADCAEMVLNFTELAARGEYPGVTLGHPTDTAAPKFGELREAWWDPAGNCIMGPLDELNPELGEAIEAGAFDKVSIVFADNWWDPVLGRHRNNVITEVGVLGAKWGAFKPQPDKLTIARTMSEAGGKGVKVYRLSMADMEGAPDDGGGEDVEIIEELKARIVELTAENETLKAAAPAEPVEPAEPTALEAKVTELEAELELARAAKVAADEKISEATLKAKEATVDAAIAALTTADKKGDIHMLPHEAVVEKARLMAADDSRTVKLAEGDGEVEKSEFELGMESLRRRPVVLRLAENGLTEEGGAEVIQKGDPKPTVEVKLSASERKAAKGFGQTPEEYAATKAEMEKVKEEE